MGLGGGAEPQMRLHVWACDRSVLCGKPGVISRHVGLVGAEFCIHVGHATHPTNTTRSRSRSVLWGKDKRWGEGQCLLGGAGAGAELVGLGVGQDWWGLGAGKSFAST